MKINKLLLGMLALAMGLYVMDHTAVGAKAYNAYRATLFPGDVQVDDLKLAGNDLLDSSGTTRLTVGSTNALVGSLTVTGSITPATGMLGVVPSTETVASAATITADACGGIKRITNASAVTTNTTDTFTAPSASLAGCNMFVINVGTSTITLDANAKFVSAAAGNVAVAANDAVGVACDGSKWYQTSALLDN
jgi:hypothetical protein